MSERSWLQASLPLHLGGLGLRSSIRTAPAAFLASCNSSLPLVCWLLGSYGAEDCDSLSIPGMSLAHDQLKHLLPSWNPSECTSQHSIQTSLDTDQFHQLFNASSIHDHAHLNSLYTGQFTASWLQAVPNPNLGLAVVGFNEVFAAEQCLFALPLQLGGLGICNPVSLASNLYDS